MERLMAHLKHPDAALSTDNHAVKLTLKSEKPADGYVYCFTCDVGAGSDGAGMLMADGGETAEKVEGFLSAAMARHGITYKRHDRFFTINLDEFASIVESRKMIRE